jgi:hypothetical protein
MSTPVSSSRVIDSNFIWLIAPEEPARTPPDFDAAEFPILAKHWPGLAPSDGRRAA